MSSEKRHVGLFFGTFNPIHIGHLIIANYMAEYTELDEVWLVVTPHNPLKIKAQLLDDRQRYHMVFLAIEEYPKLRVSDIEFRLPQPNYTVNSLAYMQEKYPQHSFSLIMGSDNLQGLHRWKNYETLLQNHSIYVYPRPNSEGKAIPSHYQHHPNIYITQAPLMEISASLIRDSIQKGKNIRPLLPEKTWKYLDEMNFYK